VGEKVRRDFRDRKITKWDRIIGGGIIVGARNVESMQKRKYPKL